MAPIAKPNTASFAVKSVLCQRIVASAGWFTWAGSANAFRIVQTCGIVDVVDGERPGPAGRHPDAAVALPEADERGDDGDRVTTARRR